MSEQRWARQVGCKHVWKDFHSSVDKKNDAGRVQCSACGLVIRSERIGNMRTINCGECGKFLCYAEEIAGNSTFGIKCKNCGSIFKANKPVL